MYATIRRNFMLFGLFDRTTKEKHTRKHLLAHFIRIYYMAFQLQSTPSPQKITYIGGHNSNGTGNSPSLSPNDIHWNISLHDEMSLGCERQCAEKVSALSIDFRCEFDWKCRFCSLNNFYRSESVFSLFQHTKSLAYSVCCQYSFGILQTIHMYLGDTDENCRTA